MAEPVWVAVRPVWLWRLESPRVEVAGPEGEAAGVGRTAVSPVDCETARTLTGPTPPHPPLVLPLLAASQVHHTGGGLWPGKSIHIRITSKMNSLQEQFFMNTLLYRT